MNEVPAAAAAPRTADAPEPVRTLEAAVLRLMSVWASEMPNEDLVFAYNGTLGAPPPCLRRVSPLSTPEPGEVRIPANTAARPQRLDALSAVVDDVKGEVVALDYGAAFWSEAAVEKFLMPYLAALGGGGADVVLRDLATVWNGYPDGKQVFALLHRARRPVMASLDLDQLLDVWYLDRDAKALRVSSVGEFLPMCTYRPLPAHTAELPYSRGDLRASRPLLPREYILRRVGEQASAERGIPFYFPYDVRRGCPLPQTTELPTVLTDLVLIPASTRRTRPGRPQPSTVSLHPSGGLPVNLSDAAADAAFWSTGTVSRVLFPYYALTYGGIALGEINLIYRLWTDLKGLTESDAEVYALIHLPKSDWGTETVETSPVSTVGTVFSPGGEEGRKSLMAPIMEFLRLWCYR